MKEIFSPSDISKPGISLHRSFLRGTSKLTSPYYFKRNPKPWKLTCLVINCRSLKNKIADIAAVIDEHKPDVILGNESWLNSEITSSEIFPAGYTVFRKNRVDGQIGGGVFQAIKGDIIATHRVDLDTDCEIIWSQCQTAGRRSKSLFIAPFYRPHAHDVKSLDELDASLWLSRAILMPQISHGIISRLQQIFPLLLQRN